MVSSNDRPRGRGARGPGRFLLLVVVLAVGFQIPLIAALAHLGGRLAPFAAIPAVLTAAFIGGLVRGRTAWATPGPLRLYLVMWPFFIWWTLALLFSFAAPVALALAWLFRASTDTALVAALVAADAPAPPCPSTSGRASDSARSRSTGLPEAFDGYRIAQISDLHCGPFASGRRVARLGRRGQSPRTRPGGGDRRSDRQRLRVRRRGRARARRPARARRRLRRAWATTTTSATARRWSARSRPRA